MEGGGCVVLPVRLCGLALLSYLWLLPPCLGLGPNLSSRNTCMSLGNSEVPAPPSSTGCQGLPSRGP